MMRLLAILISLSPVILAAGQSGPVKKITLREAVFLAMQNNPSAKTENQKKALVAEVEGAYFYRVYQMCRYKTLQEQACLLQDMERVANLRYNAGDIDLLEKTGMISRIAEIRTEISMMDDDMAITGNKLKLLLYISEEPVPVDSILIMYALQKGDSSAETDSIARFVSDLNRENLEFELNKYFKKIRYFERTALAHAEILIEKNRVMYENEEIDYIDYTRYTDEGFRIRLEYLQTLNQYNQTAIQLEQYVN